MLTWTSRCIFSHCAVTSAEALLGVCTGQQLLSISDFDLLGSLQCACIYEVLFRGGSLPLKDEYPGVPILRSLAGWGISGLAQHHVHSPAVHSHFHSATQPMGFIGTLLKAEFTTAYLHWTGFI